MDALGIKRRGACRLRSGAGARPASSRHCGRSARAVWSPATATTSRTFRHADSMPASAEQELRYWYQVLFPHRARTRRAHQQNRRALYSPVVAPVVAALAISTMRASNARAAAWDNPDFVDVTIQSYRHRYGNAPGDPAYEELERRPSTSPATGAIDRGRQSSRDTGEAVQPALQQWPRHTRASRIRPLSPATASSDPCARTRVESYATPPAIQKAPSARFADARSLALIAGDSVTSSSPSRENPPAPCGPRPSRSSAPAFWCRACKSSGRPRTFSPPSPASTRCSSS